MTSCCHCCKTCPKTNYKLDYQKCGVCALMGKNKCYFEHGNCSPPHRQIQKRLQSTEQSTKRPYGSPEFSQSNNDRRPSPLHIESLQDESIYVNPFESSKNQTIVIPVYYDVQIAFQAKNNTINNETDLTTFRPYLGDQTQRNNHRREPLNPNQLMKRLNIRI